MLHFRKHAANEFSIQELLHSSSNHTLLLSHMQHYGAPTRLLDWSLSPWIAAYFASWQAPGTDGLIFVADATVLAQCVGKQKEPALTEKITQNEGPTIDEFMQWSCDPQSYFTFISPGFEHRRFTAQQGWYTISNHLFAPHDEAIQRIMPAGSFWLLVIPAGIKHALLHHLEKMNITAGTLFPGVEGVALQARDILTMGTSIEGSRQRNQFLDSLVVPESLQPPRTPT